MDGRLADLFATDPPYLVNYDGSNRTGAAKPKMPQLSGSWDQLESNARLYDCFIAVAVEHAIKPNAAWYHWHASRTHALLDEAWRAHGALVHAQIILDRGSGLPGHSWFMWQHEPCLMGWLEGNRPKRVDKQRLTTIWRYSTPRGAERPDHPTPKPIEVFELPMRQHTRPSSRRSQGDICYEPFAGSGTQFIAAEKLGRRCFGLEREPAYCDLIVRRFIATGGSIDPDVAARYRLNEGAEA